MIDFEIEEGDNVSLITRENIEEELEEEESLKFLLQDTASFTCLKNIELSLSSLHGIEFYFTKPKDPGIDDAFYFKEPEVEIDDIGVNEYVHLCKGYNIVPIRRIKENLDSPTLDLKFYGLTDNQVKCLMAVLRTNAHVKYLNLQDNNLSINATMELSEMIKRNNTITKMNLRECRIGKDGTELLADALLSNKILEELDLSFNDIGDDGFELLVASLTDISSVKILNLSHNKIGDNAGLSLYSLFEENWSVKEIDLSWNWIFDPPVVQQLFQALSNNESLKCLNLSWNGIGSKEALVTIQQFLMANETLEYLDLSHNRMTGEEMTKCLKTGIEQNKGIREFKLGFNRFTTDDMAILANAFLSSSTLTTLDLSNHWFSKNIKPVLNRIKRKRKTIIYDGIHDNHPKFEPPIKQVILRRAQYLAENPKKKKFKKNFGHFILSLHQDKMTTKDFQTTLKKNKVKLDKDLVDGIVNTWPAERRTLNLDEMKQSYLQLYPDTVLPQPKKKKKKGKKKKKKS